MGLRETRIMNNIRDNEIPWHIKNYKEFFGGGELEFDINWDEWSSDYDGVLNLNGYVLQQFTDALNRVGSDDAAKQALREGLSTVKVARVETASDRAVDFSNGVLSLHVAPAAGWDGVVHSSEIARVLLENL